MAGNQEPQHSLKEGPDEEISEKEAMDILSKYS